MKKTLFGIVALALLGGECATLPTIQTKQPKLVTYSNTKGRYSFQHPNLTLLDEKNQPAQESSNPVKVLVTPKGEVVLENGGVSLEIKSIKQTVYPENKFGQLTKEYFPNIRAGEITQRSIKIGTAQGWEVVRNNQDSNAGEVYRLLYFPHGADETLLIEWGYNEIFEKIIQTFQFIK